MFCDLHLLFAPPRLWCDNVSAIYVTSNPVYNQQMFHVKVDYHYVCEKVTHNELQVGYVSSTDQLVDLLTKGLFAVRFEFLLSKLVHIAEGLLIKYEVCF